MPELRRRWRTPVEDRGCRVICMCSTRSVCDPIELELRGPDLREVIGELCDACANLIALERNVVRRAITEAVTL